MVTAEQQISIRHLLYIVQFETEPGDLRSLLDNVVAAFGQKPEMYVSAIDAALQSKEPVADILPGSSMTEEGLREYLRMVKERLTAT